MEGKLNLTWKRGTEWESYMKEKSTRLDNQLVVEGILRARAWSVSYWGKIIWLSLPMPVVIWRIPYLPLLHWASRWISTIKLHPSDIIYNSLKLWATIFGRKGFPGCTSGKEPTYQCRRHKRQGFDPWVRKIHWRRAWQSTLVFLSGESWTQEPGGLQSIGSQSQTQLKQLTIA